MGLGFDLSQSLAWDRRRNSSSRARVSAKNPSRIKRAPSRPDLLDELLECRAIEIGATSVMATAAGGMIGKWFRAAIPTVMFHSRRLRLFLRLQNDRGGICQFSTKYFCGSVWRRSRSSRQRGTH